MNRRPLTVVFAGGGTGGHLYPALAIADAVRERKPDALIVFIGTPDRIEARVVPARGYAFETIRIAGLSRRLSLGTVLFPFRAVRAVFRSWVILRRLRPSAVVGTGGYVSGPPVFVATCMRIPTLLHEQNSYPGVTTRLLGSRATELHLTFERSRRWLRARGAVVVSGNPTRAAIGTRTREDGARLFRFDAAAPTLLVFGGSQGAASLNAVMLEAAPRLARDGVQVLWATGERRHAEYAESFARLGAESSARVCIVPYIERMEDAYAACDLAVTRSGATTLAELTRAGVPSILVPYPHAAADHQTENARAMVEAGAAVLVSDAEIPGRLLDTIRGLLADKGRLREMAARARVLGAPQAADTLAEAVLRLAGANRD